MGANTSVPPKQTEQPPGGPGAAPPHDGGQNDANPEDPQAPREPELKDGVVYDPETGKHFDPYTGEYVVTPGHYEPPPPPQRPLRVKVRKRDHVRLRKKRRPPKPERIPTTPPPPPPQPPVYYDENGDPLPPEYDEFGNLVGE
ncbi:hypothetical protein PoB_004289400 [Plakobranchus ocellatus]|uniref:OCRE domain-containing protein n=1 Tax=Plakobranchus ocellatus TaxID=259542 RepID=A0AAV4BC97_9GAST|nr:hypothetical protein PoB_004289400 [Plakobranchus ocellatus]